jgi:hypothetical protein
VTKTIQHVANLSHFIDANVSKHLPKTADRARESTDIRSR